MIRPLLLAALAAGLAFPAAAADGAKTFKLQCAGCHQAASSPMGPALAGVAGGRIAGVTGFAYSPALKAKTGTWTDANLDAFLTAPAKFAPGGRMATGVAAPADRAAVIVYLKSLK